MQNQATNLFFQHTAKSSKNFCVGQLIEIDAEGRPYVDFLGNHNGPVQALTLIQLPHIGNQPSSLPCEIMLYIDQEYSIHPIVLGIIHDKLISDSENYLENKSLTVTNMEKRLHLEATEEVVLKCGKSSIVLNAQGKVLVKGSEVISRAAGEIKIRGVFVSIN